MRVEAAVGPFDLPAAQKDMRQSGPYLRSDGYFGPGKGVLRTQEGQAVAAPDRDSAALYPGR
jgi:hypothetical protein